MKTIIVVSALTMLIGCTHSPNYGPVASRESALLFGTHPFKPGGGIRHAGVSIVRIGDEQRTPNFSPSLPRQVAAGMHEIEVLIRLENRTASTRMPFFAEAGMAYNFSAYEVEDGFSIFVWRFDEDMGFLVVYARVPYGDNVPYRFVEPPLWQR